MEENIHKEQSQLEQSYNQHVKNYPPEDHNQIFEYMYEDQFYNIEKVFPKIMRTSALISQYSYFEKTLNTICNECERNYNISLSPEDIRHNGIKKYLFYLQRVVGLNINDTEILWQKIYAYNQIRNRFVHSPDENFTAREKATFEQKVKGLSFEQHSLNPNIFELKSIDREINTDFFELLTQALKIVSSEIKKKDKELGQ
ncbi:hypothetical protein KHA93_05560 [Bacillus sp. FJAT-49732]|uniref:Apea-like HEPN domain-containing protein n=1 Tax=Lederbergia citrisecunda TaxID=2833583 RepID=A0A942TJ68_9BACI|nr:hypothetical protein [Lederbergia citrisecunda]MBS4199121.1 hypothetical protein [Lederbergia citrisecunda]